MAGRFRRKQLQVAALHRGMLRGCRSRSAAVTSETDDDLHHEPSSQTLGPAQNDDATTTSSEASRPQLCFLPVSEEAKKCRTLRMRWFFDVTTGACKEFAGCREKGGNNFKKRKSCEKTCALPKPSTKSQDVTPEEKVASDCSLPVVHVATGCRKVHKRWYFDPTKASCQRFDGCETPGNNFRTKKQCKHVCTSKRKLTRVKDDRALGVSLVGAEPIHPPFSYALRSPVPVSYLTTGDRQHEPEALPSPVSCSQAADMSRSLVPPSFLLMQTSQKSHDVTSRSSFLHFVWRQTPAVVTDWVMVAPPGVGLTHPLSTVTEHWCVVYPLSSSEHCSLLSVSTPCVSSLPTPPRVL
ncbi:hypothetical protein C0Q70_13078 [Pomacea canaliculata]|uniref:BPTI/Kunitz inhibitor domain-containing protein n=1 Tax=Pomacea canaliculata TaxID=400727 RepID=A0A2T7NW94_POMCA|nr:hypothetical protein C0Q70_13078 [Pomacea canaliculata]